MLKKYFGDRKFYKMVLLLAIPIMIQNGITNFVNMLDNVMVGQLGTEAMSAVSIVNNLMFVFNLTVFGAISSAGIFTAQYHGFGDRNGIRNTFRFKLIIIAVTGVIGIVAFIAGGDMLINMFLHDSESAGDLALTLNYAKTYLAIMLIGLFPYAISQAYASTLRETEQTVVPMVASIAAVATNFVFNYIFIFGNFGAPALGIRGAAIATVISRFVELAILVIWTHRHTDRCEFIIGAFRSFRIPAELIRKIVAKGLPLMFNEIFWSTAVTFVTQAYSMRGLDVVAALNISNTLNNLFNIVYIALGNSIAIVIGNLLGAGKLEEAKDTDRKMITFSVLCSLGMAIVLAIVAPFIPLLYKTTDAVRELATYMMWVIAAIMPFCAFCHASYFTLRSGGKVFVTFLLDSVYMWLVVAPIAFCLSRFTSASIFLIYPICHGLEIPKVFFGALLLKKTHWVRQLVSKSEL